MHMETDLLNSVGEIRPGEGEVLQSAGQTPVGSRIIHRSTQISRQLRLSVDWSGAGLAISHPSPLQNIEGVLPLVKEKTMGWICRESRWMTGGWYTSGSAREGAGGGGG